MSFALIRRLLSPLWKSPPSDGNFRLGARGEALAARRLKRLGYRILERNYRCAAGEIDLIAIDGDVLVFVEVKTRSTADYADPAESVGRSKQAKLRRAARHYLGTRHAQECPCRFDVVTVVWPQNGKPAVEHFPAAFLGNG